MGSYFIPQRGKKKRTGKFPVASPTCLPFSALTSHVAGDMHDGEGERRQYQVAEWARQQFLSPSGRPRGTGSSWRFFLFVALRTFRAHSAGWWNTYTLSTARHSKEGCHLQGTVWVSPANPTCHGLWSLHSQGCHSGLSVEGSWCLVPAAVSASAALTAAPKRKVQDASWNWTR